MADKRKIQYRGRTYKVASLKSGRKTVHVKGYCRRPASLRDFARKVREDMPF